MNQFAVKTKDLTRDFGRLRALDGLSMDVAPGTVLALLGPNGAGKTTLLRILMGLIEPSGGQAWVLGAPARRRPPGLCARIAAIGEGQDPPRWATLRMLECLQAGASNRFDRAVFRGFCATRDLTPGRHFGALSKGQKRWVLAALAFASGAELLLMDEPADGLDPSARRGLYEYLREYANDSAATAVVATHIIGDIERVADDVAIIDAGRVVLHAPLEDLREQVRQVEIRGAATMPDLGEGASLLGSTQQGGALVGWVKCRGGSGDALRQRLGPDAEIRTVDLETLYLAIAENGPAVAQENMKEAV